MSNTDTYRLELKVKALLETINKLEEEKATLRAELTILNEYVQSRNTESSAVEPDVEEENQ